MSWLFPVQLAITAVVAVLVGYAHMFGQPNWIIYMPLAICLLPLFLAWRQRPAAPKGHRP